MLIAKVIGTTVSTIKDEKLQGRKLLVVRQTDERGNPVGKPFVAIDTVDAGAGDLVLTCAGSSARQTAITKDTPVDAVIMSIVILWKSTGKSSSASPRESARQRQGNGCRQDQLDPDCLIQEARDLATRPTKPGWSGAGPRRRRWIGSVPPWQRPASTPLTGWGVWPRKRPATA